MFYLARYKGLKLNMKSGVKKEIGGEIIVTPGEKIRFSNYKYKPKTEEEEAFLDKLIANGNKDFYKVTDEQIKISQDHKREIDEVNKKYEEKKKAIDIVTPPEEGKKVIRGTKATEETQPKEEKKLDFSDLGSKEENETPTNDSNKEEQKSEFEEGGK